MTDLWTSKLSEYLDGTLTAADRRALEDHLADCDECPMILDELQRVVQEASVLSDTPPTNDLWSGIATRIRVAPSDGITDLAMERQRGGRRISITIPQLLAAGIVLTILSAGMGRLFLNPASSESVTPALPTTMLTASAPGSRLALDQALSDLQQILEVRGCSAVLNYGVEKMRFPAPVPSGSRVRFSAFIKNVRETPTGTARVTLHFNFEAEGSTKSACTGDAVLIYRP